MSRFRQAVPVWAGEQQPLINAAVGFFWDVPACRGVLRIACAGRFRILVNGSFFAHGPERAAHGFARVEEWPIGEALVKPLNRVAIEVVAPGIASYYTIKEPAFLQAEITCGQDVVAHTAPEACKATDLPHRLRQVHRYSFQRTFSEVYRGHPGSSAWHSGGAGPAPLAVRAVTAPQLPPRHVYFASDHPPALTLAQRHLEEFVGIHARHLGRPSQPLQVAVTTIARSATGQGFPRTPRGERIV